MKKLLCLLSIFAIMLSCSSDETSTPVAPTAPIVKYTITLSAGEGGTVSTTGGEYEAGQTVSVTATPQGEYVFTSWSDGNTDATRTITISSSSTLTANFEKRKYPLTINFEGEGEVIEEIVNAGRTTEYDSGTTVKLTAVPSEGWEFVRWTGAIESEELEVQLLVSEAKEVLVQFSKVELPSLILAPKSKIFTKGVADTLSIPINIPGGFKEIKITSRDGIVVINSKPSEGDKEGNIIIEYTNQNVTNVDWLRTIAGFDIIMIEIEDLSGNVTLVEYQFRTQPKPSFRDYNQPSYKLLDSKVKISGGLIRFLNKKDNLINECETTFFDYGYNQFNEWFDNIGAFSFTDINNDGYDDIILGVINRGVGNGERIPVSSYKAPIEIYLYEDGEFKFFDTNNQFMYLGNYRIVPGDFDNDSDVDFYLVNSGQDTTPFSGEFSVILENRYDTDGGFVEHIIGEKIYAHNGTSGDYDNDGDLDIFTAGTTGNGGDLFMGIIENKGNWIFEKKDNFIKNTGFWETNSLLFSEFVDFDKDGNLDLVLTYTEFEEGPVEGPDYSGLIIWGDNSSTFDYKRSTKIPKIDGYGKPLDIDFKDLDQDGNTEMIIMRAGGSSWEDPYMYSGHFIQICSIEGRAVTDLTDKFIEKNYDKGEINSCSFDRLSFGSMSLSDFDNNGNIDYYSNLFGEVKFYRWEWSGSKFIKVSP
jgi:hypothetical protein